ncbi:MAG: hypothetical protein QM640_17350 [Niabella sp.]
MTVEQLTTIFPGLEAELYGQLLLHGNIREVKAGHTLLKTGQTIRAVILISRLLKKMEIKGWVTIGRNSIKWIRKS